MGSILNNSLMRPLVESSRVYAYDKEQAIVLPDDTNSIIYLIKRGAVTMENINKSGERKILYVLGKASLFPMVRFAEKGRKSSWFYTTLVDTEVYAIPFDKLIQKLKEIDGLTAYNMLLRQVLTETHELMLRISNHTKTDSTEKLISMFLFLLEHHTKKTSNVWRPVQFPVTHQLLADMTGLARETVTLTLKKLAQKKLIRYHEKGRLELNADRFSEESHA